jgi:hypothetical protein
MFDDGARLCGTRVPGPSCGTVVVAVLALATAAFPAFAADVSVDSQRRDEAIVIHASARLAADGATAWRILTDYGRYAEFVPDLRVSRVVARDGPTVTVVQSGDARLWWLAMPLDMTFRITETPPRHLESRAVAGSMRSLESTYELTVARDGVQLDYEGRVVPGFRLFGALEEYAVRANVARQFQALADEIERRAAAPASRGGAAAP